MVSVCLCADVILIVKPSLDLCKLLSRSSIPWKPWKRLKTPFFASEEVLMTLDLKDDQHLLKIDLKVKSDDLR